MQSWCCKIVLSLTLSLTSFNYGHELTIPKPSLDFDLLCVMCICDLLNNQLDVALCFLCFHTHRELYLNGLKSRSPSGPAGGGSGAAQRPAGSCSRCGGETRRRRGTIASSRLVRSTFLFFSPRILAKATPGCRFFFSTCNA